MKPNFRDRNGNLWTVVIDAAALARIYETERIDLQALTDHRAGDVYGALTNPRRRLLGILLHCCGVDGMTPEEFKGCIGTSSLAQRAVDALMAAYARRFPGTFAANEIELFFHFWDVRN